MTFTKPFNYQIMRRVTVHTIYKQIWFCWFMQILQLYDNFAIMFNSKQAMNVNLLRVIGFPLCIKFAARTLRPPWFDNSEGRKHLCNSEQHFDLRLYSKLREIQQANSYDRYHLDEYEKSPNYKSVCEYYQH